MLEYRTITCEVLKQFRKTPQIKDLLEVFETWSVSQIKAGDLGPNSKKLDILIPLF